MEPESNSIIKKQKDKRIILWSFVLLFLGCGFLIFEFQYRLIRFLYSVKILWVIFSPIAYLLAPVFEEGAIWLEYIAIVTVVIAIIYIFISFVLFLFLRLFLKTPQVKVKSLFKFVLLIFVLSFSFAFYILAIQPQVDSSHDATAKEKNDVVYCLKIKDDSLRNSCVFTVAFRTKNESLCEKMVAIPINPSSEYDYPDYTKDYCHDSFHLDAKFTDASRCDALSDTTQKNHCFYEVGSYTKNTSLCDKIVDSSSNYDDKTKEKCYQEIAVNSTSVSYCDQLTEKSQRDICVNEFVKTVFLPENYLLCGTIDFNNTDFQKKYKDNGFTYCPDLGIKESCYLNAIKHSYNSNLENKYCPFIEKNPLCQGACSAYVDNYQQ